MSENNVSIYRKAYARGIGEYLQKTAATQFRDPETMKSACDWAAQALPVSVDQGAAPSAQDITKTAQAIMQAHQQFASEGKVAADINQRYHLAHSTEEALGDLLKQAAREVVAMTQTPRYPNGFNTLSQAAGVHGTGYMENQQRPSMYAMEGMGNVNLNQHVPAGAVIGREQPHPGAQGYSGGGSNDIIASSKTANASNWFKRAAQGGIAPTNTEMTMNGTNDTLNAAGVHGTGAVDAANRPPMYGMEGQGNTNLNQHVPAQAVVGDEEEHPGAQGHQGASGNDLTESSKNASFNAYFRKTASAIEPFLPDHMPTEDRVKVVKQAMSMEPSRWRDFAIKVASRYGSPGDVSANSLLHGLNFGG